jgi:hypothetical protein
MLSEELPFDLYTRLPETRERQLRELAGVHDEFISGAWKGGRALGIASLLVGPLESTLERMSATSSTQVATRTVDKTLLRDLVSFLKEQGLNEAIDRRLIIEAGLQQRVGADTPFTLARFQKLILEPLEAGKDLAALRGRLGNLETRVATINNALDFERQGLQPVFEYGVGGRSVDLVGMRNGIPIRAMQFVKEVSPGVISPREVPAARDIARALGIEPEKVLTGAVGATP